MKPTRAACGPPLTEARVEVDLVDGSLRLALVADTHSSPHPALDERLAVVRPHRVLHAGDVGDLGVLRALERHAPVTAVRGNIDARATDLPDAVVLDVRDGERVLLRLLLTHVAIDRGRIRADVGRLARERDARLVVCGHSHVPFARHDRGLTVFNPGSVGPRRFALPIVFGVMTVTPAAISLRHVDCETGLDWEPMKS